MESDPIQNVGEGNQVIIKEEEVERAPLCFQKAIKLQSQEVYQKNYSDMEGKM